jgi:CheY-like chemotaxis protein
MSWRSSTTAKRHRHAAHAPDAVFLDIEMPGLDGLSAARQIAVDPGTPVIILTAHGHPT